MTEESRRAAVLDVGCFSAHLVVAGREVETLRRPLLSHKVRLRLDQAVDQAGRIEPEGIERIVEAVTEARDRLSPVSVSTFVPYATSCVRDAANVDEVVDTVVRRTGLRLRLMSGDREAQLSYVAARRWLETEKSVAVLDVGGGTLELAVGSASRPSFTRSLPLGARTLSRAGLNDPELVATMRGRLLRRITDALPDDVRDDFGRGHGVGCSKVFQQLAKLTRSHARRPGRARLSRADLATWIPRLAELPPHRRAELPGISPHRARQSLAGAVVAEALMIATGHDVVDVCPWSTKEGLLLTLLHPER